MRAAVPIAVIACAAPLPALAAPPGPAPESGLQRSPGIYSNEEDVYFAKEGGKPVPRAVFVQLDAAGKLQLLDAFGKPRPGLTAVPDGLGAESGQIKLGDGTLVQVRRARPVTCWASLRKDARKPDGSEDWYFVKDVKLHDQGGRALIANAVPGVKPVVLRMRNVTWSGSARSTNRPSLVLYVHTPDDPDHAVSYVWSDSGALRLGVNLRWMQASCTIDGLERDATGTETKAK